jgi:uncharacterized protein (TIGR03382 family)
MFEAVYAEGAIASAEGMLDIAAFAGQMPTGAIAVWYDAIAPRVLHVTTMGAGHAWPGGTGAAVTYVYGGGLDFGRFLGEFFTDNNLRVPGNTPGGGPWGDPPGGADESGGASEGGSSEGGGSGDPPDDATTSDEPAGDSEPDDADPTQGSAGDPPPSVGEPSSRIDPSGCQCSAGAPPFPAALVFLLPLLARRRSARQRSPSKAARNASSCARPN